MLNPGIKKTVKLLQEWGFNTVDSGDGETHDFECDRDHAYVSIRTQPKWLVEKACLLAQKIEEIGVQISSVGFDGVNIEASFDPADQIAIINLTGLKDSMLP